jgi:hypothetical protein
VLVPVETAGEPLTLSEPCESGLPCFDLQPSLEKTQGSTAQPSAGSRTAWPADAR